MKAAGLQLSEPEEAVKPSVFTGKTVVFTGELVHSSRSEAQALVRAGGGTPSSSVSSRTDFVVAGENPGSKYEKAKKLNLTILSEAQFREMIA